jgi:cephalosporin hydroxylase
MLFLDGNHDYEFVRADLEAWVPLVVAGGLIIGDDWAWIGVRRAAVEFMADAWIRNPGAHLELYDDLWATRKL